jgi:hypothetical protein
VLDELLEVIDSIKELPSAIESIKHDLKPPPELSKGTKAYFLSTICMIGLIRRPRQSLLKFERL